MIDHHAIENAVRAEGGLTRRLLLAQGAALAALPTVGRRVESAERRGHFANNPFALGVASGDPNATSVVIWTKLAPEPNAPDGGMKPIAHAVTWELAEDEAFAKITAHGSALATPQLGHAVHVEVGGLKPDRWYWYRFHAGDATSPLGRTRTLPARDATPNSLRFAFASCQHYEQGLYTAYARMAEDNLDLVFFLGDYIYEYPGAADKVRKHSGPRDHKIKTLADYRQRHMQYRADPLLHGMHARCPWFVTWDDHEFDNNYADDIQEQQKSGAAPVDPVSFLEQRAAAYQAYYEMMPLRARSMPRGPDMTLYRKAAFGRLAEFFVLDTRQHRTDQPNGDGLAPLNENALRNTNTLLGRRQRGWLEAGLIQSQATWNVLAQQVMFAMVEIHFGGRHGFAMDQWPGAAFERMALAKFLAERAVPNPVVLTGDIHSNWANELRVDDRRHGEPIVASEFVASSISSGGNGPGAVAGLDRLLADNPCIKHHDRERGYVRCTVTPATWVSDFVRVADVTKPGGAVTTWASFVVEAGTPGIKLA